MNSKKQRAIQPPEFPRQLGSTWPTDGLQDEGEYVNLKLVNESLAHQSATQVRLKSVWFKQTELSAMRLIAPQLSDLRLENCDLANTIWENATVRRVALNGCRMTGFKAIEAHWQDVVFQECSGALAQFRYAKFKAVRFEKCNLTNADFQGADLSGIQFVQCDLTNAEMSHTTLRGADFRSSKIDGLKVGAQELPGAIVNHFQAVYLATLLGIIVKDEYED